LINICLGGQNFDRVDDICSATCGISGKRVELVYDLLLHVVIRRDDMLAREHDLVQHSLIYFTRSNSLLFNCLLQHKERDCEELRRSVAKWIEGAQEPKKWLYLLRSDLPVISEQVQRHGTRHALTAHAKREHTLLLVVKPTTRILVFVEVEDR
jgi:2-phospho-L-lactate guanylyltransferase (CobY/MobA/RfbA family)